MLMMVHVILPNGCGDSLYEYDATVTCSDASACLTLIVNGCTDPLACNYDASANVDDGSCTYPGCTYPIACNYDSIAGCDDGSCIIPDGCTDTAACNYDPIALYVMTVLVISYLDVLILYI